MRLSSAFTLVEILIVVTIIALLAAVGIPNLLRAKVSANESTAQATLKAIGSALETYSVANASYPADTTSLLTAVPPYLNRDYFAGPLAGYTYAASLTAYSYSIVATPASGQGNTTFTISTGAVLTSAP